MCKPVVYIRKERVTIVADRGLDYLVEDEDGIQYHIDKTYFRKHYEALNDTQGGR